MSDLKYISWGDVEREKLNPLIDREMLHGEKVMLARVFLKKGGHVPLHHHHNEQVTYILEGSLKFAIDGREIVVKAGEVLCIPPHMPHEAWLLKTLWTWTFLRRRARTGSTRPTTIFDMAGRECGYHGGNNRSRMALFLCVALAGKLMDSSAACCLT